MISEQQGQSLFFVFIGLLAIYLGYLAVKYKQIGVLQKPNGWRGSYKAKGKTAVIFGYLIIAFGVGLIIKIFINK